MPVLAALTAWGDVHAPTGFGPAAVFTAEDTGLPVTLTFTDPDGAQIPNAGVVVQPGPGALR
jgi:hypothetical protein